MPGPPSGDRFRAYLLEAGTGLLGAWLVDVTYGRIGTRGRRIRHVVGHEAEAKKPVRESLRRRATAKRRIGVAYQFCQLNDPHQMVSGGWKTEGLGLQSEPRKEPRIASTSPSVVSSPSATLAPEEAGCKELAHWVVSRSH